MSNSPSKTVLGVVFCCSLVLGGWLALDVLKPGSVEGPVIREKQLMGTLWKIQVIPADGIPRTSVLDHIEEAFQEVSRVEHLMSEWKPDSPISRVNAAAGHGMVEVPAELSGIIKRAKEISRRTRGAFDVTWKGAGDLWKIGAEDFEPPDDRAIAAALQRVDYRKIRTEGERIGLEDPGMLVGLGGIAKGYAVDRAARILQARGADDFYIDGGGDIYVSGRNQGRPWRIGIRHPRMTREGLLALLEMTSGAVVTSGDYERFSEIDGIRYSHIIDPTTGRPARHCQAVTIVGPEAETVDALSTAVFVLGPGPGLKLLREEPGLEGLIVDARGRWHMTEGFRRKARFLVTED